MEGEEGWDAGRHRGGAGLGGGAARALAARVIAEQLADDEETAGGGGGGGGADPMAAYRDTHGSGLVNTRIADRAAARGMARSERPLSPDRGGDVFAGEAPARSYGDILAAAALERERAALLKRLERQKADGTAALAVPVAPVLPAPGDAPGATPGGEAGRKRRRWDDATGASAVPVPVPVVAAAAAAAGGEWEDSILPPVAPTAAAAPRSRWDATPAAAAAGTSAAAGAATATRRSRWDETPAGPGSSAMVAATPGGPAGGGGKRSRWDETPVGGGGSSGVGVGATPVGLSGYAATPLAASGVAATPSAAALAGVAATPLGLGGQTPAAVRQARVDAEIDERNRPLSDEELDALFPKGYKVLEPPAGYVPIRTPSRKLTATPSAGDLGGFRMLETPAREAYGVPLTGGGDGSGGAGGTVGGGGAAGDLPPIRPEEAQYFALLTDPRPDAELEEGELRSRRILALLLKIKNGLPPQRKSALRTLTEKARELGAAPLFTHLLPLLKSPTLEDQERHLLVKVIDRVLFKLDDLVRPYVHKILSVVEPMLSDEDYFARVEGRELISNLAKAAGLACMISVMRPDIDHADPGIRNRTARAFAVVTAALGIPAMLPFLKAVCASKKAWEARHTGLRIVQQVAILMGCAVLPHLRLLVDIVAPSLPDGNQQVRIMAALALSALAEAAAPYGIEAFDGVLKPLWEGIRKESGKALAAFLKAIGYIIPLMDAHYAAWYTREVMPVVVRNFGSPQEDMKQIVLKVVAQCVAAEGVEAAYVRADVLPDFFRHFWVRRTALERRAAKALVDTTLVLAHKVGAADVVAALVNDLKDESEPYRRMVMEAVDRTLSALGASEIDGKAVELLVDGMLYAFQQQTAEDGANAKAMLSGFGAVVTALGVRCAPFLPQIGGTIKWRLNNKSPAVRMQAADLITKIAGVVKLCGEDGLLGHLGVVLFECLGEEYPDVLGSLLGGLGAIVNEIGMERMTPPIADLLPRLAPILKNRHEKVQENAIDLVGRIAARGADKVSPREWMRICFELLEMLKAHKKAIRRACVNTFGYIAKAIGAQDVLHALLNNLQVAERQLRVCTTVAIAIVAEQCAPCTVLPALMNEYRVPDLNVQHGVLKALSFMFEYIGAMARDYVYAVTPLLEDALMDRDVVHRQTACYAVKHLALGLQGMGCEDALQHLLNLVWPNVLETFPHVLAAVFEAVEALRVALGPHRILQYLLQGLFHPARRVREAYWKLYNNLYVYSADALTPVYPRIADEAGRTYTRSYLDLIV